MRVCVRGCMGAWVRVCVCLPQRDSGSMLVKDNVKETLYFNVSVLNEPEV